jgi:hypothetical protein
LVGEQSASFHPFAIYIYAIFLVFRRRLFQTKYRIVWPVIGLSRENPARITLRLHFLQYCFSLPRRLESSGSAFASIGPSR